MLSGILPFSSRVRYVLRRWLGQEREEEARHRRIVPDIVLAYTPT